jgi:hypothetical protein
MRPDERSEGALWPVRGLAVGLAALIGWVGSAEARMHAPYKAHRIVASASAPLDTFATPSGAYSFRKLLSSYNGPDIRIRRASDNAELDIGFLGFVPGLGAPLDVAAAAAHCAATSCFAVTMYDQSGNVRHITQATPANQPALVFNCTGALPCVRLTVANHALITAGNVTPATGVVSINVVANRVSAAGLCFLNRQNGASGNRIQSLTATANSWAIHNGAAAVTGVAADNAWHTATGVLNGAGTFINIDGTPFTGSLTGSVIAGTAGMSGAAATTCNWAEGIVWDNYVLTAGEVTALQTNQKSFWGTP